MTQHTNHEPPLRTIYSPLGEKFEVSPANFYDLKNNAKWSEQKPHPDTVREYCERTGTPLPVEVAAPALAAQPAAPVEAAPVSQPAPVEAAPVSQPAPAAEAPAPAAPEAPAAPVEQTTSGEAPEAVQEADQGPAFKTEASDFDGMDRDAVKTYITDNFPGTEIDGRKGRDGLIAQALELAAASRA